MFGEATVDNVIEDLSVPFSQIPAIKSTSLWPGVIPNRTPVLWVAPGGTGKGLAIAEVTGITTGGRNFPGCEPVEPGQVITIAPEDDPNEDLAWRFRAAGADLELVKNLTILPNGDPFMLPSNEPELRMAIEEANEKGDEEGLPHVRLVTIDPLYAICENGLSSPKLTRRLWTSLQDIARDYGIAMIVSHHTTKDSRVVAGSRQLTDAARMVWMIGKADDNPDARVMRVFKSNRRTASDPRYIIEGDEETAHAVFTGPETVVTGSRAARLRLSDPGEPAPAAAAEPETPAAAAGNAADKAVAMATAWLDEHPEPAPAEERRGRHRREAA